jgi:hypothetical protein
MTEEPIPPGADTPRAARQDDDAPSRPSLLARAASAHVARGSRRRATLFDDTVYRRARRAIASTLHTIDDAVSSRGRDRLQILFEAASPMSVSVFRPVLDRLRSDPRLEFWFTTADGAWQSDQIFVTPDLAGRVLPINSVRWMKFDAYINTDFWNMTWLHRRTRRIHFFHGVAGKYGLDAPTRIAPVVASFDRLMFANRDRLRKYAAAGLVDPAGPEAALIGYPKVDCLVDGTLDRCRIAGEMGLDPRRPTVLYAPTWSPHSSLNTVGPAIIEALSRLEVNVVVKLHDRSLDGTPRGSGGVDWPAALARFVDERGVFVARDPDASSCMAAADLLVTDHSSIGFEFMLLDRPIVIVDSPTLIRNANVSRDKVSMLRSAANVVTGPADIAAAVAAGLAGPERLSAVRRRIAADLFFGAGGATDRAVENMYGLLEIPVPASARLAVGDRHV